MKNPKITLTKDGLLLIDVPEKPVLNDRDNQWYKETGGYKDPNKWYTQALEKSINEGVKFKDEDKEFILNLIIPPMKGDVSAFQAFLDGKKMLDIPAGYRVSLEYYAKLEPLS